MNACKFFFVASLIAIQTGTLCAQNFINGDFENNFAGGCDYNLPNATFNVEMPNTFAFGAGNELDIMSGCGPYCSAAASGNWYISLANTSGAAADALSLSLSAPLVAGNSYTLSFWDHGDDSNSYPPTPLQIGVSNSNNTPGTIVYSAPAPIPGAWKQHVFTFTAPISGQYITVNATSIQWTQADNFQILNPLPVQMISFSAVLRSDNKVDLAWKTASENNNNYFTAEKSNDGMNFEMIERIPGSGTTAMVHEYHSSDEKPFKGINYYRIRQTDYNGASSCSKVSSVKVNGNENSTGIFYIDNISHRLYFSLACDANELEITRTDGTNVLKRVNFSGSEIDLNSFTKGIYFLRMYSGSEVSCSKFIVR